MVHFRKYRRLSLMPALFWLLMQFATGAAFAEHIPGSDPTAPSSSLTTVICTPGGFLVVELDTDGKRLPGDSDFYPGCQWCQPFGGPAAIEALEQPALGLPAPAERNYGPAISQVVGQPQGTGSFQSRAPPTLSFA